MRNPRPVPQGSQDPARMSGLAVMTRVTWCARLCTVDPVFPINTITRARIGEIGKCRVNGAQPCTDLTNEHAQGHVQGPGPGLARCLAPAHVLEGNTVRTPSTQNANVRTLSWGILLQVVVQAQEKHNRLWPIGQDTTYSAQPMGHTTYSGHARAYTKGTYSVYTHTLRQTTVQKNVKTQGVRAKGAEEDPKHNKFFVCKHLQIDRAPVNFAYTAGRTAAEPAQASLPRFSVVRADAATSPGGS